jgi:hypothetical protein
VLGQIFPVGQEEALAEGIPAAVEQVVDRQEAEVAHRLVVGVGVDQGHRQPPSPGIGPAAGLGLKAPAGLFDQFSGHEKNRSLSVARCPLQKSANYQSPAYYRFSATDNGRLTTGRFKKTGPHKAAPLDEGVVTSD